jgi:hypothetical protein
LPCDAYAAKPVETQEHLIADGEDQLVDEPLPAQPQPLPPVIVRALDVKLTK